MHAVSPEDSTDRRFGCKFGTAARLSIIMCTFPATCVAENLMASTALHMAAAISASYTLALRLKKEVLGKEWTISLLAMVTATGPAVGQFRAV